MAVQSRAQGGRPAYDTYGHRYDLYVRAAPVLRALGYGGVTMKAIAHACGVSPPALYRYFPSKLDLALFPLETPPQGYCATLMRQRAATEPDPLRGLRAALEPAVQDIDYVVVAMRLAIEAGQRFDDPFLTHDLKSPTITLAELLLRCVPELGQRAQDVAEILVSRVIAAAATNEKLEPGVLWRQAISVLRAYLLAAGVDADHFDEVFAGGPFAG